MMVFVVIGLKSFLKVLLVILNVDGGRLSLVGCVRNLCGFNLIMFVLYVRDIGLSLKCLLLRLLIVILVILFSFLFVKLVNGLMCCLKSLRINRWRLLVGF